MSWRLGLLRTRNRNASQPKKGHFERDVGYYDKTAPSHWKDVSLDDFPQVPGMTQPDELRYFYWCCATMHQPGRRVVELGPYVGRSTMALAAGLCQSADPEGKMVSVDRFQWDSWTLENTLDYTIKGLSEPQRSQLTSAQLRPKENDSFLPLFEIFTEPLKEFVEVVNAELASYQWCGEPIDVLMVDAAKCWDALDQIIRQFFPCLIDGAAVIHQDYKHYFTYWLHPVTERMLERGVLTLAENIVGTATQGFRFNKRADFRVEDYLRSAFSHDEADRLMARSVRRFRGDEERLAVIGARCQLLKERGQIDRAKAVFAQAIREGGFADNYALVDLLAIAQDWARPVTPILLANGSNPVNSAIRNSGIRAVGPHSFAIPAAVQGQVFLVEVPTLDTVDTTSLAMNFWADHRSHEFLRIRVQAAEIGSSKPFYDEEFPITPGGYQPSVVPLNGRSKIALRLMASSESPTSVSREIKCIAPMLLLEG